MPAPSLEALGPEYERLFEHMRIRPERVAEIDRLVDRILRNRAVYEAVMEVVGMPWQVIGVIHAMECDLDLRTHLHNGDPLTARTVRAPSGRPRSGSPPFTFQESAADALRIKKADQVSNWGLAPTLYFLERYNGFGYRSRRVPTPYLWSFCDHYIAGKFVRDGVFDRSAVSAQCGSAVLLRRMVDREIHAFAGAPHALRVAVNGREVPVSAFLQKGNSWVAPRHLEPFVPGLHVAATRQSPFRIAVQFGDALRDMEGRLFRGAGHVDASDLVRDLLGFRLEHDGARGMLLIGLP